MLQSPKNDLVKLNDFYAQGGEAPPKKQMMFCGTTPSTMLCGLPRRIARGNGGDVFKFNCANSKSNELMSFQLIIVRPLAEMLQTEFIGG
jgi:hypothetical protein